MKRLYSERLCDYMSLLRTESEISIVAKTLRKNFNRRARVIIVIRLAFGVDNFCCEFLIYTSSKYIMKDLKDI